MNSTLIKRTVPALLPATLAVFLLLPVSAEMPSSAGLPVAAQVAVAAVAPVVAEMPVSATPVSVQKTVDNYDYPSTDEYETDVIYDDEPTVEIVILTPSQLIELVGPIALYPDDLLAIVLPASTYPMEIAEAARFLEDHDADPTLRPSKDWDESVTALLNYPEVLRKMYDDIEWTWDLGGAVLNQQTDLIEAVESFRDKAYAAGNLKSDDYQTVSNDDGVIEIVPANEEVIYVPYYEPRRVVVRQVEPVYYYYPRPRPVYYYPYPAGHSFLSGYFWGVTTAYGIGWSNHYLHVRHHSFYSHPYYGRSYYGSYYRQPSVNIYNTWYVNNNGHHSHDRYRDGDRWQPRPNHGNRPGNRPVDRPRTPGHREDGHTGILASQPAHVLRPVDRLRDRDGDLSSRREGPALRTNRDRDSGVRGQDRRPANAGQTANVPGTARPRDDRPQPANSDTRRPTGNTILRDRANTATDRTKPGERIRFRDRPEPVTADTRRPTGNTVLRDRPQPATADTRRPTGNTVLRDRPNTATDRTKPGERIRFRDRPEPVTANTRRPAGNTVILDRPNTATDTIGKPVERIRFRDRPAATTADTRSSNRPATTPVAARPDTRRENPVSNTTRRDRATSRPTAVVHEPARRDTDRSGARSARAVTTAPVANPASRREVRAEAPAQRQPVRQTERAAAPAKPRAEETRKEPARASKDSRAENPKRRNSKRRGK